MPEKGRFEARFYETYYFANVIRNVLSDRFAYLRHLDAFYGDNRIQSYSRPFRRFSAFHSFIEFIIEDLVFDIAEVGLPQRQATVERFARSSINLEPHPSELPVNRALTYYDIPHTSFADWLNEGRKDFLNADEDDVSEYYHELGLEGATGKLISRAVDEVFYVLFGNRGVLLLFNDMMSSVLSDVSLSEVDEEYRTFFARDGVLKRCRIPEWAKKAVFYRDRGECIACHRDLTGLINIMSEEHYDHIMPLAAGGLNDVSNLQLLCSNCNLRKSDGEAVTSDFYQTWYDLK